MKGNNPLRWYAALLFTAALVSCTKEIETKKDGKRVTFTVSLPGEATRMSSEVVESGVKVSWTEEDAVSVLWGNTSDSFEKYTVVPGSISEDGKTAVFENEESALPESATISIIYPYQAFNSTDKGYSLVFDNESISSAGVPTLENLGEFTCYAVTGISVTNGTIPPFSMDQVSSFLKIRSDVLFPSMTSSSVCVIEEGLPNMFVAGPESSSLRSQGKRIWISNIPASGHHLSKDLYIPFFPDSEAASPTITIKTSLYGSTIAEYTLPEKALVPGKILDISARMKAGAIIPIEAVDLGLSVKWGSCNLEASAPEEYGGYFAWGETETKSAYGWSNYKWCDYSGDNMTKYNSSDKKTRLEDEDDAAIALLGGSWRMPTQVEAIELKEQCTWEWITTASNVKGYRVTGKNGASIFLPATGYFVGVGSVSNLNFIGYFWTSDIMSGRTSAYSTTYLSSSINVAGQTRYYGLPIRPVSHE